MPGGKERGWSFWNKLLADEGMPEELDDSTLGQRVTLGDGLGRKTDFEEEIEDSGAGHSKMCPIKLGTGVSSKVDQPNDRPVEDDL